DVEHHECQRVKVVLDFELHPDIADCLQPTLVGIELDLGGARRAEEIGAHEREYRKRRSGDEEEANKSVVRKHDRAPLLIRIAPFYSAEQIDGSIRMPGTGYPLGVGTRGRFARNASSIMMLLL